MNAAGGHAFSLPIEALLECFIREDVVWGECGDFFPIRECDGEKRVGVVGDLEFIAFFPLGIWGEGAFANVIGLGMKFRREKIEGFVGK